MRYNFRNIKLLPMLFTLVLTACGGSSNEPVTNYPTASIVQLDEVQNINQSVDLLLHFPSDSVSQINWEQTSGEPVLLLAKSSKVVSFTPTQAGHYGFTVSFILNEGVEQTLTKNITVNDEHHKLTTRLSHEALAGNKVSFRSQLPSTIDANTVKWKQIDGPRVALSNESSDGELALFFDAPQVEFDTIISFEASATDPESNIIYRDQVAVLVEPAAEIGSNAYFSDRKASVFVFNRQSPYADALINCVYSNTLTSSCTLSQTPLLAKEVNNTSVTPSIESIMDRVVVSHQWMGDRFKDFLMNNDTNDDIKNLLRATTAIVISYDVRPSFYWAATGAIYLDAENFWLTPDERDTINEAPDYRANFGQDLQFTMPWRYVKQNAYASQSYSKSERVTRTAEEALYRLTSLMYHELAHANDFFPSNEWYVHNSEQRVLDAATSTTFESDELAISFPLNSQEMRGLAQVSFTGESANQTQKNYLPADIEEFFSPESASDYYAYSSLREDYAMLFEELMMQSRFNVIRDVAITNQPSGENISTADYIVTWGQRGRIGDDKLRDRVLFTASRVLPEFDSQTAMNLVSAPIEMLEGSNWLENLIISPNERSNRKSVKRLTKATMITGITESSLINVAAEHENNFTRYYQKPLPSH
ncbi:hypothetical protein [Colwellia psychrerythraea]|uniref:Lipoprotein n=1 Tax=Colwellia psychrerythraea TaxID=28229 RepID=A0A099KAT6_COLPS|nr:hypothetical protein [Colwellia psychrerythraea]KGJ86703.1 hypothetical protein ND2E_0875 [Colwellia psychrerythraea]